MPNMSYCRFENTLNDLKDCFNELEELEWDVEQIKESLSHTEWVSFLCMVRMMHEAAPTIEDVLEEIDDTKNEDAGEL